MGRLLLLVASFVFSSSTWAIEAPTITHHKTPEGSLVHISINGFEQSTVNIQNGNFSSLSIPGEGYTTRTGAPRIPVVRFEIEVATDQLEVSIVPTKSRPEIFLTPLQIIPSQLSTAKIAGATSSFEMNMADYISVQRFPAEQVRVASIGSVRGHLIATIEVAPIQYVAAESRVYFTPQLKVLVKSVPNGKVAATKSLGTRFDAVNAHVLNYKKMRPGHGEKLLMIVAPKFAPEYFLEKNWVRKLKSYKAAQGYDVDIVTTQETGTTVDAIRSYIQNLYQKSLKRTPLVYVLLIGDVDEIPAYQAGDQFTDNYYATVDTDNYAGDAIYRDLAVGRLSVKTVDELEVVARKILKYETNRFKDKSWTKRISWLSTSDRGQMSIPGSVPFYQLTENTHNYVINNYTQKSNYTGLFPGANEAGGDKLYSITYQAQSVDVQKAINDGRAFVVYSGHGDHTLWAGPFVSQGDVEKLTTTEALPYVMSFACLTGSYAGWKDWGQGELRTTDSFGETWLKKNNGAIGFFGTTNYSYWDEDDVLERTFFDGFFKDKLTTVGLTNIFGLNGVRKFYGGDGRTQYYYEIYNLLGDPTVALKN